MPASTSSLSSSSALVDKQSVNLTHPPNQDPGAAVPPHLSAESRKTDDGETKAAAAGWKIYHDPEDSPISSYTIDTNTATARAEPNEDEQELENQENVEPPKFFTSEVLMNSHRQVPNDPAPNWLRPSGPTSVLAERELEIEVEAGVELQSHSTEADEEQSGPSKRRRVQ